MTKRCPRCATIKPVKEFHRNRLNPDGLASWCTDCLVIYRVGRDRKPETMSQIWQRHGDWLKMIDRMRKLGVRYGR